MQSAEEFADDFREWMVVNAQWPMLGDRNATKKLEQIIAARDAEWQTRVEKLEAALKGALREHGSCDWNGCWCQDARAALGR